MVTKPGALGEAIGVEFVLPPLPAPLADGRGVVSKERVRRQEARTMEKESGAMGSCVEV